MKEIGEIKGKRIPILLPDIKRFALGEGSLPFEAPLLLIPSDEISEITEAAVVSYGKFFTLKGNSSFVSVRFITDARLEEEAYRIKTDSDGIIIGCSHASGAFYALMTLRQIALNGCLPFA